MTVSKGELLYYIFESEEGVTVDDAANWYGVDKDDMKAKLEKFCEEGLVDKKEKWRGMIYTITDKGFKELQYYVI
ncbi:MAG: MarR family winged helix-turn-helix transcriptional regulator [Halobacteriota archaeon]|nr:MarR family winged helix-turn-helix transcriptional regulator [Halobacteriota archaeon]